ncbi:MAG: hypothetical protein L0214_12795, partial [candidate division NC10 bacterium]|nr:hypothetical protein [candidate division NC10 bacterium]
MDLERILDALESRQEEGSQVLAFRLPALGCSGGSLLRSPGGAAAAVGLVALATYIMTVGYDFAFDDHSVIP